MKMRLHPDPFTDIKSGLKTTEMRLFDEKRKELNIGDKITFISRVDAKELTAEVKDLKVYKNFAEIYDIEKPLIDKYSKWDRQEFIDSFDEYYSEKLKEGYKALSIHFELV